MSKHSIHIFVYMHMCVLRHGARQATNQSTHPPTHPYPQSTINNNARLTTLMPGQLEDEVFHPEYTCPQCGSGRDMVIRKS